MQQCIYSYICELSLWCLDLEAIAKWNNNFAGTANQFIIKQIHLQMYTAKLQLKYPFISFQTKHVAIQSYVTECSGQNFCQHLLTIPFSKPPFFIALCTFSTTHQLPNLSRFRGKNHHLPCPSDTPIWKSKT